MTTSPLDDAFASLVRLGRERFGDTEWSYFKRDIRWSRHGRKPGSHFSPIGNGTPVTRGEYEANVEEGKRCRFEAFMGRYPRSYVEYDKVIAKSGWREELIKLLEVAP